MEAGLYLVGTPIGHLADITLRALETLRDAAVVLAEDTRETRKLFARHGLFTPLLSYHKFNEAARTGEVVDRIRAGAAVALVTDAGMPAVSDPGARVVAACREAGLRVTVIPGASSVTAAVALAGVASHGFTFGGFLPVKPGARKRRLQELGAAGQPIVLFESPYRLLRLLDDVEGLWGGRPVVVCREITKVYEEVVRGTPAEVRAAFGQRTVKGEIVVVIEGVGAGDEREEPAAIDPHPSRAD